MNHVKFRPKSSLRHADTTDLILGIDRQRKQGSTHWDHAKQRIKFGGPTGEWIPLRTAWCLSERIPNRFTSLHCMSRLLRLKQETDVPVIRADRRILQGEALAGVTESYKIPNLSRLYSGRTLLPARTSSSCD